MAYWNYEIMRSHEIMKVMKIWNYENMKMNQLLIARIIPLEGTNVMLIWFV